MGLFFVSLQSHKYGYMPLPKFILKDKIVKSSFDSEIKDLFDQWYKSDDNQLPNGHFVLESLSDANRKTFWDVALPKLRKALIGVDFSGEGLEIGRSVTEYEVKSAFANISENDKHKIVWLRREFDGGVAVTPEKFVKDKSEVKNCHWDFDDCINDTDIKDTVTGRDKRDFRNDLFQWMETSFGNQYVTRYNSASYSDFMLENDCWRDQFDKWKTSATDMLTRSLHSIIDTKTAWMESGCGLGLPGDLLEEMLHHSEWTSSKVSEFFGREQVVNTALQIIRGPVSGENVLVGPFYYLIFLV